MIGYPFLKTFRRLTDEELRAEWAKRNSPKAGMPFNLFADHWRGIEAHRFRNYFLRIYWNPKSRVHKIIFGLRRLFA